MRDDAQRAADHLQIAEDPTWLALLHVANGRCYVDDSTYYLSVERCSPREELYALIAALFSGDASRLQDVTCRFPARIEFLRHQLAPKGFTIPRAECAEFKEYISSAPADSIALVFAAENITSPISMMGHVFMKFEGKRASGAEVEHAASFFTNINTFNVPALIIDSLLLGMPSTFALVPYAEQVRNYQVIEGRSIFEYPLNTTDLQRDLIHMHVWELRAIKTPYLFVGYNCATVVYFLVSLADPSLLADLGYWVSPIDVVRKAQEKGIINSRRFIPSLDWQVRFYGEQLGRTSADAVLRSLQHESAAGIHDLAAGDSAELQLAFAQAVLKREQQTPRLLTTNVDELLQTVRAVTPADVDLEVVNLKDPTSGPKSSRVTVGASHFRGEPYAKIEFLPASHSLSDDNRRSNSESTLELGQLSMLFHPDGKRPIVEKASLYGLDSLVPYDPYVGGTSSRLLFGIERQWDGSLSPFTAGTVTAGLGKTLALGNDARLYGLLNGAMNYGDGRLAPSYFPELGGILYEVLSMKTVAQYRFMCGQHGADSCYQTTKVTQSLLLNDSFSPYAAFETFWNSDTSTQIYEVGLKWYL